ncbi:MAG: ATP-binding protein [Leptolyngbyaceae cyanobacterium bins.59]|nr:ATP-binding protein [Leptolyngbyaceae cyanobacterium bins.59]
MDAESIAAIHHLRQKAASLLLFQSVLAQPPGKAFLALLELLETQGDPLDCLKGYGEWFQSLAAQQQTWQQYLMSQILRSDNPLVRQIQRCEEQISSALMEAARQDLRFLQALYQCNAHQISDWVKQAANLSEPPTVWSAALENSNGIQTILSHAQDWGTVLEDLTEHYKRYGAGIFVQYGAFRWQHGKLIGIAVPDRVQLSDLAGYSAQRNALLKNTEFLMSGYPALHVLLYGSRGSGKSSLIKALLSEYSHRGLRLIEIAKADLQDLPLVLEEIRNAPQKFVLFVDDLSFEEDENEYKALKVILEGNLTARPNNVVVYATSNRRHLIREFFSDRPRPKDAEEIHHGDTVQEKLSFSDRFGLTLTFEPADQNTYLEIVHHLAEHAKITLEPEYLEYLALQWATRHNGRSGRTARQFIDFLQADLAVYGSEAYRSQNV